MNRIWLKRLKAFDAHATAYYLALLICAATTLISISGCSKVKLSQRTIAGLPEWRCEFDQDPGSEYLCPSVPDFERSRLFNLLDVGRVRYLDAEISNSNCSHSKCDPVWFAQKDVCTNKYFLLHIEPDDKTAEVSCEQFYKAVDTRNAECDHCLIEDKPIRALWMGKEWP
jgi:hypothetical protein